MPDIKVISTGKTYSCQEGGSLLRTLLDGGEFIDNACNGVGVCGKCKVRVLSGDVSGLADNEKKLLTEEELADGVRLACMVEVFGDAEVELIKKELKHKVLVKGYMPEDFVPDEHDGGYGAAIDIGTTTVVTALVDMKTGDEIAYASMVNAQKSYGLDVLTRITYEYENGEDGIRQLQEAIASSINDMLDEACGKMGLDRHVVRHVTVGANCTMMHMLLGVDARSIGKSPFIPEFTEAQTLKCSDIGIDVAEGADLYCLPQVSGYIGADIVAGAYVCQLDKAEENVLFIDIGTNGEIVLSRGGDLLCCSCAAGPALEGMNISSGMRAAEGAVEDVYVRENGIELHTIGDKAPVGICGSGILAILRELLKTGIVTKRGAFVKYEKLADGDWRKKYVRLNGTKREFVMNEDPELLVTQGDVRQVQLAKGAILSGFMALLNKAGLTMEDLDCVMIAGQFGAHLPEDSLISVGILPEAVRGKMKYVGNSSKTGAYMALMSEKAKRDMEALAKKMHYFELAETDNYERVLMKASVFPSFER